MRPKPCVHTTGRTSSATPCSATALCSAADVVPKPPAPSAQNTTPRGAGAATAPGGGVWATRVGTPAHPGSRAASATTATIGRLGLIPSPPVLDRRPTTAPSYGRAARPLHAGQALSPARAAPGAARPTNPTTPTGPAPSQVVFLSRPILPDPPLYPRSASPAVVAPFAGR